LYKRFWQNEEGHKMAGLDLQGFTKIKEDHKTATLSHPKGHSINILKSALSPELIQTLNRLPFGAKGGDVAKPTGDTGAKPVQDASPYDQTMSNGWNNIKNAVGMKDGGDPPKKDEKPDDTPPPPEESPEQAAPPTAQPPAMPELDPDPQPPPNQPSNADLGITTSQMPDNVQTSVNAPSPEQERQAQEISDFADNKDFYSKGDQDFHHDLYDGHVTAKNYHDMYAKNADGSDRGTLSKLGTIFGLLVGGAGSGLAHQQNALLGAWDKQISNDLEAQKSSKLNAQNFLRINQADIQNKMGAQVSAQQAQTLAEPIAHMNALRASYHKAVIDAQNLTQGSPEAYKAQQVLMSMKAELEGKISNIQDLGAMHASAMGINIGKPRQGNTGNGQGNSQSGSQGQSGQGPGQTGAKNDYSKDHILKPGANDSFTKVQYQPQFKDDKAMVATQLENASQADKAIDMIHEHLPQMQANIKNIAHPSGNYQPAGSGFGGNTVSDAAKWIGDKASDVSGFIHQKAEGLSGVPYVGHAIAGLGKTLTPTDKNKDYDVHRNAVATAMQGVLVRSGGMTPSDAEDTVNDMMPTIGDDSQMARNKMNTMIEKIKAATAHNALDRHNMTRNPQK
jgi:hypothetical protein